ncbi:MAG: anaerobic ribonucleoside-triphosphate reductase activating protein, partial [Lactobacillus sp.]|nr:anaerobic ribonucleoside-triphosphate reductase activating protein [Lactobacillus sp.]
MPEKDKNNQEGPDVRGNLIKVNVGGDTIFVDSNQYKPQVEHAKELKRKHRLPKNPKPQEWKSEEYSKHK